MQLHIVFKTLGLLLMAFSLTQLPPVAIDLIYDNQKYTIFLTAFVLTLVCGFLLWLPFRNTQQSFRIREGVFLVAGFWILLSLFATIPFMLSDALDLSFSDAFFESMSGLTTTGSTVLSGLDDLPHSILYYRQQLQWLGGMGIVVLAVAVLPMLGMSAGELFHAEMSGISKERLTPKLAATAKVLWLIYVIITFVCALAYYLAGMSWFDALGHSYSTVAIGGFSTHDESIGFFDSVWVEAVAIIFMFVAGVNFSLHFLAWRTTDVRVYGHDSEFKTYGFILALVTILAFFILSGTAYYADSGETFRYAIFQAVSIATTTGFVSADFSLWPVALSALLIFASFVGASAGSTGGGIKTVRVLLMFRLAAREIKKFLHPNAQINIKLNRRTVGENTLTSVWAFFALYVIAFLIIMTALLFTGMDQVSAFSATVASINNLGPGLGEVAENYSQVGIAAKWILAFSMLLGRLEILTLVVLLHRAFWRF